MSTLGDRIRALRGNASQAEFANKIGVSQRSVGHYEKDERQPDAETIKFICTEFCVSADWLVFGEERLPTEAAPRGGAQTETADGRQSAPPTNIQPIENAESPKKATADVGSFPPVYEDVRALEKEMRQLLKENGDLRVENERLKYQLAAAVGGLGGATAGIIKPDAVDKAG